MEKNKGLCNQCRESIVDDMMLMKADKKALMQLSDRINMNESKKELSHMFEDFKNIDTLILKNTCAKIDSLGYRFQGIAPGLAGLAIYITVFKLFISIVLDGKPITSIVTWGVYIFMAIVAASVCSILKMNKENTKLMYLKFLMIQALEEKEKTKS
ncbi:hypothetical protein [Halolactibacillus sp. JCM 19043]|uniref:hypothetical protein n=1 Tax=Halolactibacillus sp. JCM 19043 TaxID=1460638 RepID=UPI000782D9B3|nr:hypothetical protein [Halolactibacillus sp. JCM 19043]